MSKKTKKNPTGSFSLSGGPSASYKNGNTTVKLNDAQQNAFDFAQNSFAENLGSINVFSPETLQQLKTQVNAYKNNALEELNNTYTPLLQEVRNDAAKRFGNLDNSVFLNNLETVENQRAKAISKFSQDVASKEDELIRQQLQERYDYLNFLNSYQKQIINDALNIAGLVNTNANTNGKYQANAYTDNTSTIGNLITQIGKMANKLF